MENNEASWSERTRNRAPWINSWMRRESNNKIVINPDPLQWTTVLYEPLSSHLTPPRLDLYNNPWQSARQT